MSNLKIGATTYPCVSVIATPRLKVGSEYLELTTNSAQATSRPRLGTNISGTQYYVKDVFGTDVKAIQLYTTLGNNRYSEDGMSFDDTDSFLLYEISATDSSGSVVTSGALSEVDSSCNYSNLSNANDGSTSSYCRIACDTGSDRTGNATVTLSFDTPVNLGSIEITFGRYSFSGRSISSTFKYQTTDNVWHTFYSIGNGTYTTRTISVDLMLA